MEHLFSLLTLALISLLAAISPGPDFFIVLKNSLSSRKAGILTAIGVSAALIIHLSYTLVGLAVLIQENIWLYKAVTYAGALYLFYIGYSSIKASFEKNMAFDVKSPSHSLSDLTAFKQGFLTNLLNPKAAVFFISLFSQYIDPTTPASLKVEFAFINWAVTLAWFILLTYIVTSPYLLQKIHRFRQSLDRIMGSALILISLKLLLT